MGTTESVIIATKQGAQKQRIVGRREGGLEQRMQGGKEWLLAADTAGS